MPRSGRISIDLAPLRVNPDNKVIIRFTDVNEASRNALATRIKETCPIYKIKKASGPTVEKIYQALTEINPIVFAENLCCTYIRRDRAQNFNIFNVKSIQGYYYRKLCSELYHVLCLRRPLRNRELVNIAYLTNGDWNKADLYVQQNIPDSVRVQDPVQEIQIPRIEEFGLEDMERVQRATAARTRDNSSNSYQTRDIPGFNNPIITREVGYSGFSGTIQANPNPEPTSDDELIEEFIREEEELLTGENANESLANNN